MFLEIVCGINIDRAAVHLQERTQGQASSQIVNLVAGLPPLLMKVASFTGGLGFAGSRSGS